MPHPSHKLVRHRDCTRPHCPVCEGGLEVCAICGGTEAIMPTECPGARLTDSQVEGIMDGKLDFINNQWRQT